MKSSLIFWPDHCKSAGSGSVEDWYLTIIISVYLMFNTLLADFKVVYLVTCVKQEVAQR